MDILSVI